MLLVQPKKKKNGEDKKDKLLIIIIINQKVIFETGYFRGSYTHVFCRNMKVNTRIKLFNYLKKKKTKNNSQHKVENGKIYKGNAKRAMHV